MIDVHLPTTDGRELVLTRYTEPEPELNLLLNKLKLDLRGQPPPKNHCRRARATQPRCSAELRGFSSAISDLRPFKVLESAKLG
jgi:hypothetical protein